ncbi:hypothetical protein [Chelativorans alearense]|uniref:hypothetical protein n=1 Tax=Chelativorans alearense TaxID=2681495 RepID=UPI001FE2967B|nr:hypothetical protein [Chelativorans alearense]
MDICTFWYGPRLREVDQLCLASMVMTGQRVKLFSYEPVLNVPAGVECCEAEAILPRETFKRLDPGYPKLKSSRTIPHFSDLFRVTLMRHKQGVWLDTDIYLVKRFEPDPARHYLARENRSRLGVSALYLPENSPIIAEFERYIASDDIAPRWLGIRRRVLRPMLLRLKGKEVTPAALGITIFANDGISRMAKRYGIFRDAAPKESFYYWNGKESLKIFSAKYGLEPLHHPHFIGFHIHQKGPTTATPEEGSFYHWARKRVFDHGFRFDEPTAAPTGGRPPIAPAP